jgi:hypothetical protein
MGNPIEVREWNSKGLPSDTISVNNGILVTNCMSYPLLIDPQTQANRWIKQMEYDNQLKVAKYYFHIKDCLKTPSSKVSRCVSEWDSPFS